MSTKTILVDAVFCLVDERGSITAPLYDLLEKFPNPKVVLTGANDDQMQAFKLHELPYPVFTLSHDPEKTDPAYYRTFLSEYTLSTEDVVYIEHAPEAVASARSLGIPTFRYESESPDLDALRTFLAAAL